MVERFLQRRSLRLSKEDIHRLTWFIYNEPNGLLASVFARLPLPLKRHCVQVGATAGLMAMQAPENAIPKVMTREEYANAVRYGSLYHDIGAYLVYNQKGLYPDAGGRLLREELKETKLSLAERHVIIETVENYGERYDGQGYPDNLVGAAIPLHAGICAVANEVDGRIAGSYGIFTNPVADVKKFVTENKGSAFSPEAVECFIQGYGDILQLYNHWRKNPPFWKHNEIRPLDNPIDKPIG